MKYVSFRMNDEEHQKLTTLLKSVTNKSPSKFFSDLANKIISDNVISENIEADDNHELNHVKQVRLTTPMLNEIKKHAIKNRWSDSKEIRFRLNQTMSDEPVLLDDEIAELRGARNAVDRIGQNIFYIIAKRQLLEVNDPAFWDDIKQLNAAISEVKEKVNKIALSRRNIINVKKASTQG